MNYIWELLRKAGGSSFELAVWGMYFGIFLACLLALYEKRVIGGFVRTLLKKEAFSPEKAMTLQELGYGKNPFVRGALRGKTALSSLVYMPGEDPGDHGGARGGRHSRADSCAPRDPFRRRREKRGRAVLYPRAFAPPCRAAI